MTWQAWTLLGVLLYVLVLAVVAGSLVYFSLRNRGYGQRDAVTATTHPGRPSAPRTDQPPLAYAILGGLLILIVAALLIPGTLSLLSWSNTFFAENGLPAVLLIGSIALVLSLAVVAIIYKRLGLDDKEHELGLPEGSVRAVIALLLILLFFISSIFLVSFTRSAPTTTLAAATQSVIDKLPADRIVKLEPNEGTTPQTYAVEVTRADTAVSNDLAKQLLTTVSTLVVSIAAFYFGANSVLAARGRADGGTQQNPGGTPVAQAPPGSLAGSPDPASAEAPDLEVRAAPKRDFTL